MKDDTVRLLRLIEFTDSACPVGTFSFSNGLETAAERGLVHDAATLEAFASDVAFRAAWTDGVAALNAHRSALSGDWEGIVAADRRAFIMRPDGESRQMTRRMGRKAAELADRIMGDDCPLWCGTGRRWLESIRAGSLCGTHPVTMAVIFAACGIGACELFCSLHYGVLNTVLSAALRCVRVSHYDTQRILFDSALRAQSLYQEVSSASLDDMNAFSPQADILASLHEKGNKRMFMN